MEGPAARVMGAPDDAARRVIWTHCNSALWQEEREAATNAVSQSPHTKIALMPNHSLNMDGELGGFMFSAHPQDSAAVLPVGRGMCRRMSMYECASGDGQQPFNEQVLHVVNNLPRYRTALRDYVEALRASDVPPANFDCIPARDSSTVEVETEFELDMNVLQPREQHVWRSEVPDKVGLYHAYSACGGAPVREHKLYIMVSGCLTHAAEELHNLWQDTKHDITCMEFVQSEELQWLRMATQRSHNRLAADLASIFDLRVQRSLDLDDPTGQRHMLYPTTSTAHHDVVHCEYTDRVKLTDCACLPESSTNGILFEMYSAEGFWLYHGPRDFSNCSPYGGEFACTGPDSAFPTKTSQFNERFKASTRADAVHIPRRSSDSTLRPAETSDGINQFLYPSESFMRTLQGLGFNRNDGITHLMPLVCYVADE
jgi:hypothetical protein